MMKNFLQCIWWNDTRIKPEENRAVLVLRHGRFFSKAEVHNSSFLPDDAIAWCYLDTDEVGKKWVKEL